MAVMGRLTDRGLTVITVPIAGIALGAYPAIIAGARVPLPPNVPGMALRGIGAEVGGLLSAVIMDAGAGTIQDLTVIEAVLPLIVAPGATQIVQLDADSILLNLAAAELNATSILFLTYRTARRGSSLSNE